ncbi:MAG: 30S ribosomal protein S13 [Candidatus Omnitrophota bacterium]
MPRIAGIDLPKNKRIEVALRYIFGISSAVSNKILGVCSISPDKRAKDLTDEEVSKIASVIQRDYRVEGDLKRDISQHIKRLMEIGSYRGARHKKGLPARGQRTRTNARTRKGPKRTVGVRKIKETAAPSKPAPAAK